jgi:cytochrome b561
MRGLLVEPLRPKWQDRKPLTDMAETTRRYTTQAIALHWLLALLMLVLVILGWFMIGIARGTPARGFYFNLHKSIGIVGGVAVVLQLWWRAKRPPPALPTTLPKWQITASGVGHHLLYLCMVLLVLSGYVEANFTKYGIRFFGLHLPPWGWEDSAVSGFLIAVHRYIAYVFTSLVAGHIAAAIYHGVVGKEHIVARMLPARFESRGSQTRTT